MIAGACRGAVEAAERAGLVTEDDVLPHRQIVRQLEVLEHHSDAAGDCFAWRLECHRLAVQQHLALVGTVRAVQRLHQGALAGAVLADDGVDRARHDPQIDSVVGHDAGEALDDAA